MRFKTLAIGLSVCAFVALAAQTADAARPSSRVRGGAGWGDCVRTVRALSDFTIRGDGWMWWQNAAGVHERDNRPQVGSVLVFKRTASLGRGHVSLVSAIVDKRTVLVDHTWLAGRGVKRGMEVQDVSPANDWSAVRVWHGPTDQLGQRVYPTYGFILPDGAKSSGVIQVADRGDSVSQADDAAAPVVVAPKSRRQQAKLSDKAAIKPAMLKNSPAFGRMMSPLSVSALMTPPRKPTQAAAHPVATRKPVEVKALTSKPASRVTVKKPVVPGHKPKAA